MKRRRVLFVCLGNICRSPAAEAVFKSVVQKNEMENNFYIDSAGTSAHHAGEMADERMITEGEKRGYDLTSISRKFIPLDFGRFDKIIVMDNQNLKNVLRLATSDKEIQKVSKMTDYCSNKFAHFKEVPDPYFGGLEGFRLVYDLLEDSCEGLYQRL